MSQVGGTGLQCSGHDSWECREDAEAETDNEHGKKKIKKSPWLHFTLAVLVLF